MKPLHFVLVIGLGLAAVAMVFLISPSGKPESLRSSAANQPEGGKLESASSTATTKKSGGIPQSVIDQAVARATSREGSLKDASQEVMVEAHQSQFAVESSEADAEDFPSNPSRTLEEKSVIALTQDYQKPEPERAAALLGMLPSLPADVQPAAFQGALELISDEEFSARREEFLKTSTTPELREALMDDILTRTEDVRLPSLVEMLNLPLTEAERSDIIFALEAYLEQNYGSTAENWRGPVQTWVSQQTPASMAQY